MKKDDNKKKITRTEYLAALGLFLVGNRHYREGERMDKECCERLGLEWGSHVSDAFYSELDGDPQKAFDSAIAQCGIAVEATKRPTK